MPNVLRVFLENAQTKSFKYDQTTTVEVSVFSVSPGVTSNHPVLGRFGIASGETVLTKYGILRARTGASARTALA